MTRRRQRRMRIMWNRELRSQAYYVLRSDGTWHREHGRGAVMGTGIRLQTAMTLWETTGDKRWLRFADIKTLPEWSQ